MPSRSVCCPYQKAWLQPSWTAMNTESSPLSPAELWLRGQHIDYQRLDYAYHPGGGIPDAAAQLGLDPHRIIKSLVFDAGDGQAVMALMHGDRRVSVRKLERISGMRRLMPASPDRALAATGYQPGGICPFGLPEGLPVFIQKSLLEARSIYINGGQRGVVLKIETRILSEAGALPCDIMAVPQPLP